MTARPLSVVVLGNSTAVVHLPAPTDRTALTYADVLHDELVAAGVRARVHVEARWFEFLHATARHLEERMLNHRPDVVVLHFGVNELMPWALPNRVLGHLLRRDQAVTRGARAYRRRVADPVWKRVRRYRRAVARATGQRLWQTTPRRFEGHLRRVVAMARKERRALVLVLDVLPPGPVLQHFMPGILERHEVMQQLLHRVVQESGDPDVRLVEVSAVAADLGADVASDDGLHLTGAGHRALGERLAAEALAWWRSQP